MTQLSLLVLMRLWHPAGVLVSWWSRWQRLYLQGSPKCLYFSWAELALSLSLGGGGSPNIAHMHISGSINCGSKRRCLSDSALCFTPWLWEWSCMFACAGVKYPSRPALQAMACNTCRGHPAVPVLWSSVDIVILLCHTTATSALPCRPWPATCPSS